MTRPEIRPPIFIALQNSFAALLFAVLLGAELVRRLLYAYPQTELLWRLSGLANRTVMPVLHYAEELLPTPDKLLLGLAAGVVLPLLAWWARYWLVTAIAGHVTLAALIVITFTVFQRGNMSLAELDLPAVLLTARPGLIGLALIGLCLFVLVMCIADHVAFLRHMVYLVRRIGRKA